MNRRQVFCGLLVAAPALAAIAKGESGDRDPIDLIRTSRTRARRLQTVRRMITETPAQGWPSRVGHGTTLVYFGDGEAFEVAFKNQRPTISTRELTSSEYRDLTQYQQETDSRIPQSVGTIIGDSKWRLRGWIYNGRHSDSWIMSAEPL